MPALVIDAGLDDDERRRRLYSGDIFAFSPTQVGPSLVALRERNAGGSLRSSKAMQGVGPPLKLSVPKAPRVRVAELGG